MRVALLSTCLYSVPPKGMTYLGRDLGYQGGYGGESQVYSFMRALCRAGVDVELFATPGSRRPERGHLHTLPQGYWDDIFAVEPRVWKLYHDELTSCDVIHDWTLTKYVHHMAMLETKRVIETPWGTGAPAPFYNANTVLWSEFQRQLFLQQGYPESTKYVHGAVDPGMFSPNYEPGDYFLYLSRIHPSKHPEVAFGLAKKLGIKLYVACDTESWDHDLYLNQAQRDCQNFPNIVFVVDPTVTAKEILYRNAKALILASESECFGLVVTEALAHGTPVIVKRDGAFPEIIEHGVHGFLCDSNEDYVAAVKNIDLIDRRKCREVVEKKFNTDRMVREYLPIYEQVIRGEAF